MKDDKNLRQQLSAVELYVLGTPNSQTREDILKFLREQILQSKTTSTELEELVRHINGDSIVSRVLDNLQEATAITDTHGNILYSNQQFKQIIPKSSGLETFVGSNIFTDYHFESSSEKAKLLEEAIRTGGVRTSSRVKYVVQDKDGKEADVRYFNIRIAPFGDKSGAQIGAVDITREVLESVRDGLTGAYSQSFYVKELKNLAIAESDRADDKYLGIIGVDLKRLKWVNDNFGKRHGDILLREIAKILMESVRKQDYVVRDGGDEFIILCPGADQIRIDDIVGRINEKISTYNSKQDCKELNINLYMVGFSSNREYSRLFESIDGAINQQKRPT